MKTYKIKIDEELRLELFGIFTDIGVDLDKKGEDPPDKLINGLIGLVDIAEGKPLTEERVMGILDTVGGLVAAVFEMYEDGKIARDATDEARDLFMDCETIINQAVKQGMEDPTKEPKKEYGKLRLIAQELDKDE